MSLVDLPDDLIVYLTSYLSYSDVCNLMETNKKNYNAVKQRGKDKPKVDSLRLGTLMDKLMCSASRNEVQRSKTLYLKYIAKNQNPLDAIRIAVRESSSINKLDLHSCKINNDIWEILMEAKNKIGRIHFYGGEVDLTEDQFISLCQSFKESRFYECVFNDSLWSDKVLEEVVPYTNIITRENRSVDKSSAKQITDRTLKALIGEDKVQHSFAIENICNSFTIKEIVNLLEVIENRNIVDVDWNLGILNENQMAEAKRYFTQYKGEIGGFEYRKYNKLSCISYELTLDLSVYDDDDYYYSDYSDDEVKVHLDKESNIYFSIAKH